MQCVHGGRVLQVWRKKLAEQVGFDDGFYYHENDEKSVDDDLIESYRKGFKKGKDFRSVLSAKDPFTEEKK